MQSSTASGEPQGRVGNARWIRLIPVAIIVYIISFMDRTNIGFAFGGMEKDLHFGATAAGSPAVSSSSATSSCRSRAATSPSTGAPSASLE